MTVMSRSRLPMSQIVGRLSPRPSCDAPFQKFLGEIFPAESESDGGGEHDATPGNAEPHYNDVLGNAQLFERHGSCEQQDAPASDGRDEPSRRQSRVHGGDEDGLRSKVREKISREQNHRSGDEMGDVG